MFEYYNPNPNGSDNNDCVIRALTKILDKSWEDVYWELAELGFLMHDMPSVNKVWDEYLRRYGFYRNVIPNMCPTCYTVLDFCRDHPTGKFVLATGSHVVAVVNGDYYDSWNSGNEVPIFYYRKG